MISTKTAAVFITVFIYIILICGCTKTQVAGKMPKAGIALTFDDNYVDDWYRYIKFFDSFNIKATFYISNYNKLTNEQKIKLHALENHGHEIAYHSTSHPDFVKYLKRYSMGQLEEKEIKKGMEMMKKDGFNPVSFAYPFGSHNEALDNCLLRKFKSIRFLNGTKNFSKSFTTTTCNSELYAMGIDLSSGKSTEQLVDFISLAKKNDNCLVLVGHHIERKEFQMGVPYVRLRKLITAARELNMQFYTISDISRQ